MTRYDYDFVLENYVGGGGRWQWVQFTAILCQAATTALPFFLSMFAAYTPDHRCHVPLCDGPLNGT